MATQRSPWWRRLGFLALLTILSFPAACNTTEGIGEDIESAGEAIDDAAEDAHD